MSLEAAITVDQPRDCPVAAASAELDAPIETVIRSSAADGTVVEEFEVDGDTEPPADACEVFSDQHYSVYRFEREADRGCACECIETFGCPVADITAIDGQLRVVFRPDDLETLREIIGMVRERYGGVRLEHLVRSGDAANAETVVVDRGRLTDRQREVIATAYEMGYFEHPKGANAQEVAATLDINSATLRGHLAAAQSKLLKEILDG